VGIVPSVVIVLCGFTVGALLTSFVGRWVILLRETLKSDVPHPGRMAVLVSLFHAGPWLIVVVAVFACYEYSERWAQLLGVGILAWGALIAQFLYRHRALKRKRQEEERNAA